MQHVKPLPALLAALFGPTLVVLASGCGDLSQEDLLFRAALPSKSELELRPAGAPSQADDAGRRGPTQGLECDDDENLRCKSLQVAETLNGVTFDILDLVDAITAQRPSQRSRGRRVWGPYFDEANDNTGRFEMVRRDDGVTYDFCLHLVPGRLRNEDARDLSCDVDVDEDTGLTMVLSGFFTPGDLAGARARSGQGEVALELGRLPQVDRGIRRLVVAFDNDEGRTHINLTLFGARIPGTTTERSPVEYEFTREADGSGTFFFDVFANIAKDSPRLEQLLIAAQWNADQAGRADASISGGDAGNGLEVTHCWDAEGAEVYAARSAPPGSRGDVEQCAFQDSALP